jgi:head-tail adaptor
MPTQQITPTGKRRHRVTIQSPVSGTDPFQTAQAGTFTTVLTVWASIEPLSQKAISDSDVQSMQVSHRVTMRYLGANYQVGAGDQLLYGTRVFLVQKGIVNFNEKNAFLILDVWEINPTQGGAAVNG